MNQLKNIEESTETLLTFIVHNTKRDTLIFEISLKLGKSKDIKDIKKKKKIGDRLHNFIVHLENLQEDTINNVFFIGETLTKFPINPKYCNLWNIPQFLYFADTHFKIDYLLDIFENKNFLNVIHADTKKNVHYIGTRFKKRILSENVDLESMTGPYIIYGKTNSAKTALLQLPANTRWENIFDEYDKLKMKDKLKKLEVAFSELNTKSHLFVFSSEIQEAIDNFLIKELYITQEYFNTLNIENSNFEINMINSIEKGDQGDRLIRDFNGVIGIKYY